jgi:hypothetical protein
MCVGPGHATKRRGGQPSAHLRPGWVLGDTPSAALLTGCLHPHRPYLRPCSLTHQYAGTLAPGQTLSGTAGHSPPPPCPNPPGRLQAQSALSRGVFEETGRSQWDRAERNGLTKDVPRMSPVTCHQGEGPEGKPRSWGRMPLVGWREGLMAGTSQVTLLYRLALRVFVAGEGVNNIPRHTIMARRTRGCAMGGRSPRPH